MKLSDKHPVAVLAATGFIAVAYSCSAYGAPIPLAIQADTVLSGPCVLMSRFKPEDKVIFRIRVTDTQSGEPLEEGGLKKLVVVMPDGTEFTPKFGPHPPQQAAGHYWTYAWTIPADYPTGSHPYKVVATTLDDQEVTLIPFEAPPSQLTIVAEQ